MKLIEWNLQRASVSRFRRQMDAVNEREPDILALAEVGIRAGPKADEILGEHGFDHVAFSQTPLPDEETTASGVLFASRFPFETLPPREFGVEYPDRTLSVVFETPYGDLEGHVVHVPPGSSNDWDKVEFLEAIHEGVAESDRPLRFLCGDFNSPKQEHEDGTTEVFGQSRGQRWIDAERNIVAEPETLGLVDAYREVHGPAADAWSHELRRKGELKWQRRFDHVFASPPLAPTDAAYLHDLDDLSDHTPLEIIFEPETDANAREPSSHLEEPATDKGAEGRDWTDRDLLGALDFTEDARSTDPNRTGLRRARFKVGWRDAVEGNDYGDNSLDRLTWQNLGWRLGQLFGPTPEPLQDELYDWCVEQQGE